MLTLEQLEALPETACWVWTKGPDDRARLISVPTLEGAPPGRYRDASADSISEWQVGPLGLRGQAHGAHGTTWSGWVRDGNGYATFGPFAYIGPLEPTEPKAEPTVPESQRYKVAVGVAWAHTGEPQHRCTLAEPDGPYTRCTGCGRLMRYTHPDGSVTHVGIGRPTPEPVGPWKGTPPPESRLGLGEELPYDDEAL